MTEANVTEVSNPNVDKVNAELKDLYDTVSQKIRLSISGNKFTIETLQTILVKIVETVEELSAQKDTQFSGTEKRAIAINLTHMVLDDLHNSGKIDDQTYDWLNNSLVFLAPIVFAAAKAAWTKLQEVESDVAEHGVSGCCGRNFLSKKK